MSLKTYSTFFYGIEITQDNNWIDFDEGSGEISVEIDIGSYTLNDFIGAIATAMNTGGTLNYVATVDRSTRLINIAGDSNFTLKVATGSHIGTSAFPVIGFNTSDRTGDDNFTGDSACATAYSPQFILQSHIDDDDWQGSVYATVNKSANGNIEVVSFGTEKFIQFEIKFSTNLDIGNGAVIRNNPTGHDEVKAFMKFCVTKAPIEFMEDENDPDSFKTMLLESTADDSKGLSYKLKELYTKNLPGFFDTGNLKFRLIE